MSNKANMGMVMLMTIMTMMITIDPTVYLLIPELRVSADLTSVLFLSISIYK